MSPVSLKVLTKNHPHGSPQYKYKATKNSITMLQIWEIGTLCAGLW